jgi:hypothetical protein
MQNCCHKTEGKRSLRKRRCKWEDNIKMGFKEIVWEVVEWIDVTKERNQLLIHVNKVMKFRVA